MKKILFTLACLLGIGMAASAFNNSAVVLLHNGNATTYEANQINDAMEAAQDGDVVMLSEGTYPTFTIKKKITVKGTGELTIVRDDINIDIPNTPILIDNLLEFMYISGKVTIKSPLKGLRIKQCNLGNLDFSANTYDSYIDRGHVRNYLVANKTYNETITVDGQSQTIVSPYIKGLTVTNSFIQCVVGLSQYHYNEPRLISQNTTFINCQIQNLGQCGGTVINSIINGATYPGDSGHSYIGIVDNTIFVNSYYNTILQGHNYIGEGNFSHFNNCYTGEEVLDYTTADLASLGYLGNDGTIIGPLGGNTPYTLEPAVPTVTESSMKVDTDKQQLQVTLTVSPK